MKLNSFRIELIHLRSVVLKLNDTESGTLASEVAEVEESMKTGRHGEILEDVTEIEKI